MKYVNIYLALLVHIHICIAEAGRERGKLEGDYKPYIELTVRRFKQFDRTYFELMSQTTSNQRSAPKSPHFLEMKESTVKLMCSWA